MVDHESPCVKGRQAVGLHNARVALYAQTLPCVTGRQAVF